MAATNRRGIFSLLDVRERQGLGVWSVKSDVWLTPTPFRLAHPYGYFGGGAQPSRVSTVDRIDYSNDTDTASPKGPLSGPTDFLSATGNADFGYFAGGQTPSTTSKVDRIEYGNDTVTASPKGPLSLARYVLGATGNASYGYFGGGIPGPYSTVDRIDYSNDTATASPKGDLSLSRYVLGATGNSSFGYFAGGRTPSYVSTVDRIDYSNDTATAPAKGPLSSARGYVGATGNASFGYFAGGGPGPYSTVDRIDYSNDTATAPAKGPLSVARYRAGATGNANSGFIAGGATTTSSVERIDYSNDTATASVRGQLTANRFDMGSSSPQANAITTNTLFSAPSDQRPNVVPQGTDFGYFGGGGLNVTVFRIDYNNDTVAASTKGPLSVGKRKFAATGNSNFGYFGGGEAPGSVLYTTSVDRIDYANDTATALAKGPLSLATQKLAATGNSSFGYFGGGISPSPSSKTSISRIDYSNDTATASPKGAFSDGKYEFAGTGNQSFGYFGGGNPGKATVSRIDYSNDTATASTKGPLSAGRPQLAATGNASFGYFGGGRTPSINYSTVDRIDYSNDTATASPKGPLSAVRYQLAATGNSSFGYFGGGSPGPLSTVERVDYTNDTATASPKGPLGGTRYDLAASSSRANAIPLKGPGSETRAYRFSDTLFSPNTGYFGGGNVPSPIYYSSIDRIDYSNDTATASSRGPLNIPKNYMGAAGNIFFGYFGGGLAPSASPSRISSIDRIDYSNDTATASSRGPLSAGRYGIAATGNQSFGYFAGGVPYTSIIDRVDYSNDTATASPKGPLNRDPYQLAATGNQSFGYFTGGTSTPVPTVSSLIDRVDYSNDTATASSRGSLGDGRRRFAATGNQNFGYFGGGITAPGSYVSIVERVGYSNDTATASLRGPLTGGLTRRSVGATGSNSFGYFGGGTPGSGSKVDRVDYSNDTATASLRGPLSASRYGSTATSARADALPQPPIVNNTRSGAAGYGYFGGGLYTSPSDSPTASLSSIDRIDFANDTTTTLSSILNFSPARRNNMGSVASSTHGYWVSGAYGDGSTAVRTTDSTRMEFSNDTGTLVVRGNLPKAIYGLRGVGNSNSGYFIGGDDGTGIYYGQQTTINRIDYSNDSVFTTVGDLDATIGRRNGAAVGNQNFGYYAGGYGINPGGLPSTRSWSDIHRIDYSNDTSNAPVRAQIDVGRYSLAGTGNANFGYFSGGISLYPTITYSSIVKYDYANDTTNASPTANLTGGNRDNHMATGGQNHGYFAGGSAYISSVEKFDYSNDTTNASPKGPLSGGNRGGGGACSAGANGLPN